MKDFILKRVGESDDATFGVLFDEYIPFCLTLERKWSLNQPNISCIPAGEYITQRISSPKFGETFEITNVKQRTEILFHKGNFPNDSHGCVLLGETFSLIMSPEGVLVNGVGSSGLAFIEFMKRLEGRDSFKLRILYA